MPITSELGKLRQEECQEFETSLGGLLHSETSSKQMLKTLKIKVQFVPGHIAGKQKSWDWSKVALSLLASLLPPPKDSLLKQLSFSKDRGIGKMRLAHGQFYSSTFPTKWKKQAGCPITSLVQERWHSIFFSILGCHDLKWIVYLQVTLMLYFDSIVVRKATDVAHQLRALNPLPGDADLVPSTYMVAYNHL